MQPLTIVNRFALGDMVCISALVRDIHKTYPNKYELFVSGHYLSYWKHCPYVKISTNKINPITPQYREGIINSHTSKKHFLYYLYEDFYKQTKIKVPCTEPKGEIFLSKEHKEKSLYDFKYWVILAGCKADMTTKLWDINNYQTVVSTLKDLNITCIQAGADFNNHFHPRLKDVINAIGKTDDIHDLFRLIYHSQGVICSITGAMHIASVFDKPCVVIAGGREFPSWEHYTNKALLTSFGPDCAPVKVEHTFLHTIGKLDCCKDKGCWKDRILTPTKMEHKSNLDKQLCKRPIKLVQQTLPECMTMIKPKDVINAVLSYENQEVSNINLVSNDISDVKLPSELITEDSKFSILDDPIINGKFTICILGYGNYKHLMQRCLESIINHNPLHRLDIRVSLNDPGKELKDYILSKENILTKIYLNNNIGKYPAMRDMFWDDSKPIKTKYLLWLDDDSYLLQEDSLIQLSKVIIENHNKGYRQFGTKFIHDLLNYKKQGYNPEKWFYESTWWLNNWLHLKQGSVASPNGSQIVFCTGGFWALCTDLIKIADIPDKRLVHNGGDIVISEQVHQAGFKVCDFSRNKNPVRWSDAPPRGISHKGPEQKEFPWSKYI